MEMHDDRAAQDEDHEQKYRHFKGIRKRKWGKWVSEIRMPGSKERIWLGSYKSAEQAARAYDAAVYCLRGPDGKLNFPDSVPDIPSASSLSRQQIQHAAAKYALDEIPSTSSTLHNDNNNQATEKPPSPSPSSWISETELSSNSQQISMELDLELLEYLFDGNGCLNLGKSQSIDEELGFIPTSQQEERNEQ